jgi:hypothetical protein
MSFEYRNFPDITGLCALCRRYDGGAPFLHLLSIATEGEYTPAICNRCVEHMFNNWPNKPEPVTKLEMRAPTDEEIGRFINEWYELMKSQPVGKVVIPDDSAADLEEHDEHVRLYLQNTRKVKSDDNAADNARRAATHHADTVEQQQRKARKRAQGTD